MRPILNAPPVEPGVTGAGAGGCDGEGTGAGGVTGERAEPPTAAPATIGWLRRMPPVDPRKRASPNEKMPPSDAISQPPLPVGVLAIPTIGWVGRSTLPNGPASPKAKVLPSRLTSQ